MNRYVKILRNIDLVEPVTQEEKLFKQRLVDETIAEIGRVHPDYQIKHVPGKGFKMEPKPGFMDEIHEHFRKNNQQDEKAGSN